MQAAAEGAALSDVLSEGPFLGAASCLTRAAALRAGHRRDPGQYVPPTLPGSSTIAIGLLWAPPVGSTSSAYVCHPRERHLRRHSGSTSRRIVSGGHPSTSGNRHGGGPILCSGATRPLLRPEGRAMRGGTPQTRGVLPHAAVLGLMYILRAEGAAARCSATGSPLMLSRSRRSVSSGRAHHLHYSARPEWASTLACSLAHPWMPSWGGLVNGLFTLRGAWHKRAGPLPERSWSPVTYSRPCQTFERGRDVPSKSVNAVSHLPLTIRTRPRRSAAAERVSCPRHPLLVVRGSGSELHSKKLGDDPFLGRPPSA